MTILFYYLAAFILFFSFLRTNDEGRIMNRSFTDGAKGFFILLVVLSHLLNTFPYEGFLSGPLSLFRRGMGQLCVAPFFLISGYGLFDGYRRDGDSYNKKVLNKHIIEFYLITVFLLVPYFVIDLVNIGHLRNVGEYLLFLIGLNGLGSPNWFIFAILFCYVTTFLIGLVKPNKWIRFLLITICCAVYYCVFAFVLKYPMYWYNTIISFPLGCLISNVSKELNKKLSKRKSFIFLFLSLIAFGLVSIYRINHLSDILKNIIFASGFVFASYLFKQKNKFIIFIGINSWFLYMIHLIPINLMKNTTIKVNLIYFISICFTLSISALCSFLKPKIFKKK